MLRLAREEAKYLGDVAGLSPYDALIDQFEPGMTTAEIDRVFGDLQTWLPGLVRSALARQGAEPAPIAASGPFAKA